MQLIDCTPEFRKVQQMIFKKLNYTNPVLAKIFNLWHQQHDNLLLLNVNELSYRNAVELFDFNQVVFRQCKDAQDVLLNQ